MTARRPATRGWVVDVACAAFVLLASAGCDRDAPGPEPVEGPVVFPPPPARPAATVSGEDFAGAERCAACHAEQYDAWRGSTHGRAGGAPAPGVVIAPFDGTPIVFADARVLPRVRDGLYEFAVRQDGFDEVRYEVVGVIGGGHMLGGGTQGFLTRLPDGTERFLPWDWSRQGRTWFCNTGTRRDAGWLPITPEMRLADCGDWPPLRPIGTVERFANCQECHGSQIGTTFDAERGRWETRYTTLRVNCESCHGPARRHVERAEAGGFGDDADLGLESLAYRSEDEALEVCFGCHALKDVLEEGWLSGEPLERYYALKFPALGDRPWQPDGRVRTFAYQGNHLASACYLEAPLDCGTCHEPHGQGYRDVNGQPLSGPFDDGQCTSCHASKAVRPEEHTFHPPDSEGSRCVSCHMPYLQHPEVGPAVPFARSDHTIPVPRPAFDASLGVESACIQCHGDRSPQTLQEDARRWWGELKPHRPLVRALASAVAGGDRDALLLRPEESDPLIQFQALGRVLVEDLEPDASALPEATLAGLRELAASDDLDVRALALAALHWSRGEDPATRRFLVERLEEDAEGRLRERWKLALGFLGDHHRGEGGWARSLAAYRKALEIAPGDPAVLRAAGLTYNAAGEYASAATAFRRSIEAEPGQPLVLANLGVALAGAGDEAGARAAYEAAIALNPRESVALFNLGNLHRRAGDPEAALDAYRRAAEADPGLGRAHFEVARTLILLDRPAEALPHARRAVEFLPDHGPSREMLGDLERAFGGGG